jgi:RNA polymerase sigma-70 factor (sigma-E family)
MSPLPQPSPPDALVAFVREQHPRVVGTLTLYTGDRHRAEELAQETFVRVCRDWDRIARMNAPGAWVHRVAMNLAHSSHRRSGAERRAHGKLIARGAVVDGSSMVEAGEDPAVAAEVRRAVLALPDGERAVIALRYFADLSVFDTAAALGIPEGTVKTRTRRAIEALRTSGLLVEVSADE